MHKMERGCLLYGLILDRKVTFEYLVMSEYSSEVLISVICEYLYGKNRDKEVSVDFCKKCCYI